MIVDTDKETLKKQYAELKQKYNELNDFSNSQLAKVLKENEELKEHIKSFENDFDYQNKVIDKYKNDLRKLRVAYIQAQVSNVISGTDFETILKNVLNGVK